jgi:hypothetical protein
MRGAKILEKRLRFWILPLLLSCITTVSGQEITNIKLLDFRYGLHFPAADMKDRFGTTNALGIGAESGAIKSKVLFGLEGYYFFGNAVKEDVLAPLRGYDGNIIGIDGQIGDINLKERGFYIGAHAAKIFSTSKHDHLMTGIRTQIGFGILQHKIRVQDNYNSVIPLEKKYLSGYDRLSNGPAVHLGLGYQYDSPINNFHFKIMGEMIGAQTESRRDIDYATGTSLSGKRTDILFGLHLAYIVTISRKSADEHIYY